MCFIISQCKYIKLRHVHSSSAISDTVSTVDISSLRHCIRLSGHAATTDSDQIDSLQRSKTLSESSPKSQSLRPGRAGAGWYRRKAPANVRPLTFTITSDSQFPCKVTYVCCNINIISVENQTHSLCPI